MMDICQTSKAIRPPHRVGHDGKQARPLAPSGLRLSADTLIGICCGLILVVVLMLL